MIGLAELERVRRSADARSLASDGHAADHYRIARAAAVGLRNDHAAGIGHAAVHLHEIAATEVYRGEQGIEVGVLPGRPDLVSRRHHPRRNKKQKYRESAHVRIRRTTDRRSIY